jgi:hypothetical protein
MVLNDTPLIVIQFELAQLEIFVCSNHVNWLLVQNGKLHHIMGGIPSCGDITGDESWLEIACLAGIMPCW